MARTPAAAARLSLLVMTALAACTAPPGPSPSQAGAATRPPSEPTTASGSGVVLQTAWGPIWDAVPREFLVFAGAQPVEIGAPASAALDHPAEAASPADVAGAYVTDLATGGWRATQGGPFEDGSVVVDAVRNGTPCRAQVRATPLGGVVRITILYGADCPKP